MTVGFVLLTGLVAGALLSTAGAHRRFSSHSYHRERAFYAAEGGFEKACQQIANLDEFMPGTLLTNGTIDGATFACRVDLLTGFSFRVSSTGTFEGVKWAVQADRVEVPTWAKFALWMRENSGLYFIGGESFHGHVHADSALSFDGAAGTGAAFYDRITSSASSYIGSTNGALFTHGLELNSDQGTLATVDFLKLRQLAALGGTVFTGATEISFVGTSMNISNEERGWTNRAVAVGNDTVVYIATATNSASPSAAGRLQVSGLVDGRITMVTEDDTYITDNLLYANHPDNTNCDDAVGIVSQDDIWVSATAPADLVIHAAMMATGQLAGDDGSFGVIDYNVGSPRGSLHVWGSIVQEVRGAVGTFDSAGPVSGFRKDYVFDQRFITAAPPHYPRLSTKVSITGWREGPG